MMKFNEKIAKFLVERKLKKKLGDQLRLEIKKCDIRLENDGYASLSFDGTVALPVEVVAALLDKRDLKEDKE